MYEYELEMVKAYQNKLLCLCTTEACCQQLKNEKIGIEPIFNNVLLKIASTLSIFF